MFIQAIKKASALDATAQLNVQFDLDRDYPQLTLIYDRFGSETAHIALNGKKLVDQPGKGEGRRSAVQLPLGALNAGKNVISFTCSPSKAADKGHLINFIQLWKKDDDGGSQPRGDDAGSQPRGDDGGSQPRGDDGGSQPKEAKAPDWVKLGKADVERYTGIGGSKVANLTKQGKFPGKPDNVGQLKKLDAPQQWGNNYGQRIRCYLVPKATGKYTFWIASDDQSELYLSDNHKAKNKQRIAHLHGWTGHSNWKANKTQQSRGINLRAGQAYYLEILHKEGGGGDHVEVAWQGPGIKQSIIGTEYIASVKDSEAPETDDDDQDDDEDQAPAGNRAGLQVKGNALVGKDSPSLRTTAYTAEAWIRPKGVPATWVGIMGKPGRNYNIWLHPHGFIHHRFRTNASTNAGAPDTPKGSVKPNQWTHVAITNDGKTAKTYINGKLAAQGATGGNLIVNNSPLYVGCNLDNGKGNNFNGALDELRLWNYARTPQQIRRHKNRCLNGDEKGLLGYWPLDSGKGNKADDLTDNENDLKIQGKPNWIGKDLIELLPALPEEPEAPECGLKTGEIDVQYYKHIGGNTVKQLSQAKKFPGQPDKEDKLGKLEGARQWGNNYGQRLRGYLCPKQSGEYTFWIASDDHSELYLSKDSSVGKKQRIAHLHGWTAARKWNANKTQQSKPIGLKAGESYYIEVLHKEGGGGDHVAVAWQGPGIQRQVIDGDYLASFKENTKGSSQQDDPKVKPAKPAKQAPAKGLRMGYLDVQRWKGLPGGAVKNLTSHSRFPANPDNVGKLKHFEAPRNWHARYGQRVKGT